jgi:hypothetical protein
VLSCWFRDWDEQQGRVRYQQDGPSVRARSSRQIWQHNEQNGALPGIKSDGDRPNASDGPRSPARGSPGASSHGTTQMPVASVRSVGSPTDDDRRNRRVLERSQETSRCPPLPVG